VADPDHKTLAAAKLYIVAVNQTLGPIDCLGIIAANQRFSRAARRGLLRFLPEARITLIRASRAFMSQQERRLTAPRYQIGPPTRAARHGSVPPPKPHYRGGTVRAVASTEATLKRETSA
jgi:hypothetical protein